MVLLKNKPKDNTGKCRIMESDRLLSSRTSILDRRQRKTTDWLFLITLQFFILIWVSIAAYALSVGDITKFLSSDVVQQITNTLTISRTFIIIGYSILSVILFQLFLLFPQLNKINASIIFLLALGYANLAVINCCRYFHFVTLYIAVLFLCGIPLLFCLFRWEWIDLPAKIIDESIKAIRFFTYTPMLFSIFWYILCLLPLLFGLVVQVYLMSITSQSDGITVPAHVWFFSFINIICSAWLFLFLFNIGQMALCGTFGTWFWTEDKHNISRFNTIFRCLKTTVMYHLGTVAYGSSLFGITRTLTAMLKIFIQKLGEGFNLRFSLLIVYNIIDMIICRFIMYSTIVTCAVHGKRFSQSIEDAIDYLTRKPVRCLMMLRITEYKMLSYVSFTILPQLCAILAYIFTVEPIESKIMIGFIIFCYHIFMLPLLSMVFAASNTIFLCFLEDVDRNEDNEEKHYMMSPELQTLLGYSTLEESGES